MSFYAARSLMGAGENMFDARHGIVGEVNLRFAGRDHSSDGWIGDPSHAARKSDHNPDYGDGGIVRAVDIDSNGAPGVVTPLVRDVLQAVVGDPRVYYVIWNRRICSRSYGWVWRYYDGSNPHDHHVHISVLDGPLENNTSGWLEPALAPFKLMPYRVSLSGVRKEFLAAQRGGKVEVNNGIGRIQHVLVHTQGAELKVDGVAGRRTIEAMAAYERKRGGLGKPGIPDRKSLAYLSNKGKRFGIVA